MNAEEVLLVKPGADNSFTITQGDNIDNILTAQEGSQIAELQVRFFSNGLVWVGKLING